ncbi:MAG TPA: hypothetical protein VEW28_00855 [Candidatus Kapabacteria bacterium]|nr:hypothetical protein [Candidatus Kapabacteria bacterium]
MSSGMFWGALLVIIGATIMLRNVFDIHLPLWDVIFPSLLILWGVSLLFKNVSRSSKPKQ